MKNLKRALSFAIAAVMLVGMMAVGTSAFTDDADIVNDDAVNIMNQLGIIAGKPDGSFDPTATVTRGEMAKMICVALNGGKTPVLDATVSSYPDTVGHWAAGYIEYCKNLGIVSGSTDGNFYPNAPITGTEAAKMVLIALGYDAKNEKFVNNADWSTNINVVANTKGLYADVTSLPGAPISRDNAAQMLFNGLSAVMVKYDYQLNTVDGNLVSVAVAQDKDGAPTILTTKFNISNASGTVLGVRYDDENDKYFVTVETTEYEVGADYSDLYMQEVKVLVKDNVVGDKAYGLYAYNCEVMMTGVVGDIDTSDEAYDEIADSAYYAFNAGATTKSAVKDWWTCAVIDNDADGEADLVVVNPVAIDTVDYASKTSFTMGGTNYKYEDAEKNNWVAKAEFAEDDYVAIVDDAYSIGNDTVFTKLEVTENVKINGEKADGSVRIDTTWYTPDNGVSVALDDELDVVIVNGYIVAAGTPAEADKDVLMVTGIGGEVEFGDGEKNVKVMYADGTTAIIAVANAGSVTAGKLYTWEVEDGIYTLSAAAADAMGYTAEYYNSYSKTSGKVGTYRIADDAVVFVDKGGKYSVIAGADLKKMNTFDNNVYAFADDVNGFPTMKLGLLVASALGTTGDTTYGYVVGASYQAKEGDDTYTYFDVWNGTEVVTVKEKTNTDAYALVKGDIVSYTDEGDGVVDVLNNTYLLANDANVTMITAFDGENVKVNGAEFNLEDCETVVLYVDSKNDKGVEGGKIAMAMDKDGNGTLDTNNVVAYVTGTGADATLVLLVVDVANEWYIPAP